MYVSNNSIKYENRSRLKLFYMIFLEQEIKLFQSFSIIADSSHSRTVDRHRNIKFLPHALLRLRRFGCYLHQCQNPKTMLTICQHLSMYLCSLNYTWCVQQLKAQIIVALNCGSEQRRPGKEIPCWHRFKTEIKTF